MKILTSIFLIIVVALSFTLTVDDGAMKIHEMAFNRAMISFGLAKALNAVISLMQGTQLSFAPIGIGLNFSVGEVLDPLNDMVERFSWVMLLASISLGAQKIILLLSAKLFLQVALAISVFAALFLIWIRKFENAYLLHLTLKFFALLMILRFSAIVFVYSSELLYSSTLQEQYDESSKIVNNVKVELEDVKNKNNGLLKLKRDDGFFRGLSSKYSQAMDGLNISKRLNDLEENMEQASQNIIKLITIFVVQSVLLPLLYLWIFVSVITFILKIKFNENKLKILYNA